MRAFVPVRNSRFDYDSLTNFEVVFLFESERDVNPLNTSASISVLRDRLSRLNFDPSSDYFVMTGPAAWLAIFFAVLGHDYSVVKTLVFDARTSKYVQRVIDCLKVQV